MGIRSKYFFKDFKVTFKNLSNMEEQQRRFFEKKKKNRTQSAYNQDIIKN